MYSPMRTCYMTAHLVVKAREVQHTLIGEYLQSISVLSYVLSYAHISYGVATISRLLQIMSLFCRT